MLGYEIDDANKKAVDRMLSAEALLVDMKSQRAQVQAWMKPAMNVVDNPQPHLIISLLLLEYNRLSEEELCWNLCSYGRR